MRNKIGIFDSGIGGLTTLEEIRKLLPNESYIYYADSKHNPYGEKSDEKLYEIVKDIVNKLLEKKVKIIVIACNTATTRCIEKLRNDYPKVLFVGTEPAIKVACDNGYNNTIVMATPGTIASERIHDLISKNQRENQNIYLLPCEGLANAIETNDLKRVSKLLHEYLDEYKDKSIDSVVLGCTHYPHIKKKILNILPNVKLIDGNIGVANRVKYLLEKNKLINKSKKTGTLEIINSNNE